MKNKVIKQNKKQSMYNCLFSKGLKMYSLIYMFMSNNAEKHIEIKLKTRRTVIEKNKNDFCFIS
jgi:hypothetical protein